MRPFIPALLVIIMLAVACNGSNKRILSAYFKPANLPEQTFTINTAQDTTVITKQGIKIHIPAGAIDAVDKAVTLTVKEALTLDEILKAGLTTTTGNQLLASDGMFYIGTKEKASIKKPLQIFLPTPAADNNMQLYKGVENDGKIDWRQPAKLNTAETNMTDSGEVLFKTNCTSCHSVDKELTGPALLWEDKYRPLRWLRDFTRNNFKLFKSGDRYTCCLLKKYLSKGAMTNFDFLSDYQIDAMYRYIDKESKRLGIPYDSTDGYRDCDSCYYYKDYFYKLQHARDSLVKTNSNMVDINMIPPDNVEYVDKVSPTNLVSPTTYNAEYYQFDVTSFGWFNVDALLLNYSNLAACNVKVKINNAVTKRVEVFFVLPSFKVFQEGGLLADKTNYGFYTDDGELKLPQGANAFVFALGEERGKMYFGETPFVTSPEQLLNIDMHESTKKQIEHFFATAQAGKIKLSVSKTKNFKTIKAIDDEIGDAGRILKNCSCVELMDTAIHHY
jgi:mono/diheme cytochrome c family protein